MRFGIIGAGRIGKIHASNVAARKDCEVRFIADADRAAAESLAEATGGRVAEIDAILASHEIDAVAICAPTDMHADLIEKAARAKKAIFCEKPVDLDANRVRACLEVVAADGAIADGRLQPALRSQFRGAAEAHRATARSARSRSSRSPRAIPARRRSPTSPAPAACSAT